MSTQNIRLTRRIKAIVDGVEHDLSAGWQTVDKAVADHWFVKANTDNEGSDSTPDMRDAQIVEISRQNSMLTEQLANAERASQNAGVAEAKVVELELALAAAAADRDNALTEKNDLAGKVSTLQVELDTVRADLAATKASAAAPVVTPAQDAKAKK